MKSNDSAREVQRDKRSLHLHHTFGKETWLLERQPLRSGFSIIYHITQGHMDFKKIAALNCFYIL